MTTLGMGKRGEDEGCRRERSAEGGEECTLSELTGTSSGIIEILSMLLANFSL